MTPASGSSPRGLWLAFANMLTGMGLSSARCRRSHMNITRDRRLQPARAWGLFEEHRLS